jgi:ubiquinone biosynthesis protein Coq4
MKTFKLPFQKHSLREKLIEFLFNASLRPYQWLRRNRPSWYMPKAKLLAMPENTLGRDVGEFLQTHDFEVIDKCESHDVYHVLLEYPTDVPNEIKMQYFLLGNGRRSWYTFMTVAMGALLLPEHLIDFCKNYIKGHKAFSIKKWNLRALLSEKTTILRGMIFKREKLKNKDKYLIIKILIIMKILIVYKNLDKIREKILTGLVGFLNPIYKIVMPRNRAWKLTKPQLRQFPEGTLGRDLAEFMDKNNFDLLPYLETHDVYHVLLDYKPTLLDEARMYFFLLGNGKYSLEVVNTILASLILLPDYWPNMLQHYRKGRACRSIAKWDFRYLMYEKTAILRGILYKIKEPKFFV